MKTFYLIKSLLPFLFLPIAPEVVQAELERQGILNYGSTTLLTAGMQIAFTLGLVAWLSYAIYRKKDRKTFLKMSCVSKKVFHLGQWISVERYLADHHNIEVSHSLTPDEYENWMRETLEVCGSLEPEEAEAESADRPLDQPAYIEMAALPELQAQGK